VAVAVVLRTTQATVLLALGQLPRVTTEVAAAVAVQAAQVMRIAAALVVMAA
jgi:hypothetical protein